jgi:hypothetical protein
MRSSRAKWLRGAGIGVAGLTLGFGLVLGMRAVTTLTVLLSMLPGGESPLGPAVAAPLPAPPRQRAPERPVRSSAPERAVAPEPVVLPPRLSDPSAPCALDLRLAAVVLNEHHPERSIATLRSAKPGSSRDYASGMRVGDHVLVEILPRAARFRHRDGLCLLRMFGRDAREKIAVEQANSKAQRVTKKGKQSVSPKLQSYPPSRALSPSELSRAITPRSRGSYLVDAILMGRALERWSQVDETTRAAKVRPKGLKLRTIRDEGLLEALGLRRGDVVRRANGKSVAAKEDIRSALELLARSEPLDLEVERGGRKLTLNYATR